MKSIVILLLLLVFFMSGMMFGVERDHTEYTSPEVSSVGVNEADSQNANVMQTSAEIEGGRFETSEYKQTTSSHFTQKMASFIGGIVKGFYEIIVQVLYQIAQLFY